MESSKTRAICDIVESRLVQSALVVIVHQVLVVLQKIFDFAARVLAIGCCSR